jgi:Cys-rich protein (TIGR01571 family)
MCSASDCFCWFAACATYGFWLIATGMADFAATLVGVYYLSRRRTMLREAFGIAGSHFKDFCLYAWCMPCAICQVISMAQKSELFQEGAEEQAGLQGIRTFIL